MNGAVLPWLLIGDKAAAKNRALLRRFDVCYIINVTPPRTEGGVQSYFEKVRRWDWRAHAAANTASRLHCLLSPGVVSGVHASRWQESCLEYSSG